MTDDDPEPDFNHLEDYELLAEAHANIHEAISGIPEEREGRATRALALLTVWKQRQRGNNE